MSVEANPIFFSGDHWRATHRASVVSILGAEAPEVLSMGSKFYNVDRWTVRVLVKQMCDWAKANPKVGLTREVVARWVAEANAEKVPYRRIVIAATPTKLSIRVALALVGGAYHEAFHTKYSCRRTLGVTEVCDIVLPRWAQVPDWSKLYGLLQDWNNIIEDIRIERRGTEDYPGCLQKMCELQDFILSQEAASFLDAHRTGRPNANSEPLHIVTAMFRDLGLGYATGDQDRAIDSYRQLNPAAAEIVETGPLSPILDASIDLSATDDLGCLRLAMDVLIELSKLIDPKDMEKASEDATGGTGRTKCPKCGAPASALVARPLPNGSGGAVRGKAVITCTKCGWQEVVDLVFGAGGGGEDGIKFEGFDLLPNGGDPAQGAGGHRWDPERVKAWEVVAGQVVAAAASGKGTGNKDLSSALGEAISAVRQKEDADCKPDEKPWRPWTTALDVVQVVGPSDQGKADDERRSKLLLESVRKESSFLRARLRMIVRAVEQRAIIHGVRRGMDLSERMLVDSMLDLRGGEVPKRAYFTISDKVDTSIAAAIILDQSSSMDTPDKLQNAAKCLISLTEPLDSIGSAVLVAGFRDGPYDPNMNWAEAKDAGCHRYTGICHDVFKNFDERFITARWRFANTRAVGGTPMADGIQFGLDALSARPEAHRVLFVITDGEPNHYHKGVIRRQIRIAKAGRVNLIGVGIGTESKGVVKLFPDHVWAEKIEEMPARLIKKLNELLDFRGIGRGRRLQDKG